MIFITFEISMSTPRVWISFRAQKNLCLKSKNEVNAVGWVIGLWALAENDSVK